MRRCLDFHTVSTKTGWQLLLNFFLFLNCLHANLINILNLYAEDFDECFAKYILGTEKFQHFAV